MDTTPNPAATPIDRQAQPDATHDWRTCQAHRDCRTRGRRWANKQAMKAQGQTFKENSQYVKDLEAQARRLVVRVAEGGNVEDLALIAQLQATLDTVMSDAIAALQATNPPRRDGGGASWQRIAEVLGMRKQSAWERYRKIVG